MLGCTFQHLPVSFRGIYYNVLMSNTIDHWNAIHSWVIFASLFAVPRVHEPGKNQDTFPF